jgi:hypothetical protein
VNTASAHKGINKKAGGKDDKRAHKEGLEAKIADGKSEPP